MTTTPEGGEWVAICPLQRLADQTIVCVRFEAIDLLLVRHGDRIFACERACPHEQADLSWGRVADGRLFCPRHLASFDLQNGDVSVGWPSRSLRRYPVRTKDGQIWVDAAAVKSAAA
ncbi:3-phenylpropionate/trans-cinnamate dioxygenase ferredoxin subunit [Bradyrhizobium lablabi]|uniref:3-phenylpropionate/trans-cinnamate dioxygenase ferredoxin subunit n=1 Tax=Bradyrhizobium lablabi TaxID=722472 RepID=A0A1M6JYW5_9BRAD|nr:Rieske (2Fe-2S) protein [Bradyrhizobium lablabi]SHJ51893.1 3-phenylpropionate/trans-cinnamate dioxygenase ferredoxin subunit [Bradyrhizobium lablabi]